MPGESVIHRLAKETIARAIQSVGWSAEVEVPGKTPTGASWIADVLARHQEEKPVAFEVQWSPQNDSITRLRQARYSSAGIVGVWFFQQPDFASDQSLPAFRLMFNKSTSTLEVLVPSFHEETSARRRKSIYSPFWRQSVELSAFVEGTLNGRLQFAPVLNQEFATEISAATTSCTRCGCEINVITNLKFAIASKLKGFSDIDVPIYNLKATEDVIALLPSALFERHGIRIFIKDDGKQISETLNKCVHCNSSISTSEILRLINLARPILTCGTRLRDILDGQSGTASPDLCHWWFDEDAVLGRQAAMPYAVSRY